MCPFPGWGLLRVSGGDCERFLHSQLTSDVRALEEGETQVSALLDPSGRVRSTFFLNREADAYVLLVPVERLRATRDGLEATIIADDVTLEAVDTGEMQLALGPLALRAMPEILPEERYPLTVFAQKGFVTWREKALSVPRVEPSLLDSLGLLAGLPRWGVNVREGQLVTETVLMKTAVSRDKGCYLGQETVAKVQAHRGAAYASMLLRVKGTAPDLGHLSGCGFNIAGRRGGKILQAAEWLGETLFEVLLYRDFRVPGRSIECALDDGSVIEGKVEDLPALRPEAPEDVAAELLREAVARFTEDEDSAAIRLLEAAIAVCPDFADAYETLGVIRGRRGELELAIDSMHRLAEADPHSVMAHSNLSRFYAQLGRIEDAESELQLANAARIREQMTPPAADDGTVRDNGEAAQDNGREALLRQVLGIDPEDAMANLGMGEIMLRRSKCDEAVEHLERAVAADPTRPAAYLPLGHALAGVGRNNEAVAIWRQGLEVAAASGDTGRAKELQLRLEKSEEHADRS